MVGRSIVLGIAAVFILLCLVAPSVVPASASYSFSLPDYVVSDLIRNGEFDQGLAYWRGRDVEVVDTWGPDATVEKVAVLCQTCGWEYSDRSSSYLEQYFYARARQVHVSLKILFPEAEPSSGDYDPSIYLDVELYDTRENAIVFARFYPYSKQHYLYYSFGYQLPGRSETIVATRYMVPQEYVHIEIEYSDSAGMKLWINGQLMMWTYMLMPSEVLFEKLRIHYHVPEWDGTGDYYEPCKPFYIDDVVATPLEEIRTPQLVRNPSFEGTVKYWIPPSIGTPVLSSEYAYDGQYSVTIDYFRYDAFTWTWLQPPGYDDYLLSCYIYITQSKEGASQWYPSGAGVSLSGVVAARIVTMPLAENEPVFNQFLEVTIGGNTESIDIEDPGFYRWIHLEILVVDYAPDPTKDYVAVYIDGKLEYSKVVPDLPNVYSVYLSWYESTYWWPDTGWWCFRPYWDLVEFYPMDLVYTG